MLPIVDKYKDMGTVVMGKVESGEAKKGQTLVLMPNKTTVTVDQLWSDDDEVTAVGPGENVKIKLKGVEEEEVSSGFILCDPNNPCTVGRVFDAQVRGRLLMLIHYALYSSIINVIFLSISGSYFGIQEYHLRWVHGSYAHSHGI